MRNEDNIEQINRIIIELGKKQFFKSLYRVTNFYDEPKFFHHRAILNFSEKKSDGLPPKLDIGASGVSFISLRQSLLKCLGESMERYCLYNYKEKRICYSSFNDLKTGTLDPFYYIPQESIRLEKFGWVLGYTLNREIRTFIPAQLVYSNYRYISKEKILSTPISTGAAGGFDKESAILRGIYEVVERDAFMTMYLNKISVPQINTDTIRNKVIRSVIESCQRYRLELYLFDITNDVKIPTCMTILIDRSGVGPAITVGAKANFNLDTAILGSLGEALMVRGSIRKEYFNKKFDTYYIKPYSINTITKRGLYWSSLDMIPKLNFLLAEKPKKSFRKTYINLSLSEQLVLVQQKLQEKELNIYYIDVTNDILKKINYHVYKVIIPKLQPLYLDERYKQLHTDRLKEVSDYFRNKKYSINPIPHPFL